MEGEEYEMTTVRARPRRSLRHEIAGLAVLSAVPVALLLVFPYEAMSFRAAEGLRDVRPVCAFVTLGEEAEHAALAAARTSWQVDSRNVKRMRVDLSAGDLPAEPLRPVFNVRPKRGGDAAMDAVYVPSALPPTVGAPKAAVIPADADGPVKAQPAFPREEMLREL